MDISTEEKDEFYAKAIARNASAYVWWHFPINQEDNNQITHVKVYYGEDSSDDLENEIVPDSNEKKCVISGLENGKDYKVSVCGYTDQEEELYTRTFDVTPGIFEATFDNVTAVIVEDKLYFSWAFSSIDEDEFDTVNIYVYGNGSDGGSGLTVSKVTSTIAYEEITGDSAMDTCPKYSKYYSCICSQLKYSIHGNKYVMRAVNNDGVESDGKIIVAYETDLPVVMLDLDLVSNYDSFIDQNKINANLSVINGYIENQINDASLTVKGRGNSSWKNSPKKSYTLKFKKKQSFLGMQEAKSFALIANYFDKSLVRNAIAYDMGSKIFDNLPWTPHFVYTDLFINGVYQGLYLAVETNKINKNRVDIPNLENCTDIDDFANYGWILEANVRSDEKYNFNTEHGITWSLKDPDGDEVLEEAKLLIAKKIQEIEDALYSDDFNVSTSDNYWEKYLDKDSLVDWVLIQELAKNTDSYMYSSCYVFYEPVSKKLYFGPIWDFDLGFGNVTDNSVDGWFTCSSFTNKNINATVHKNWFKRLFESECFRNALRNRFFELQDYIQDYYSDYKNILFDNLESSITMNFRRWNVLGSWTFNCPQEYEKRMEYLDETNYLDIWLIKRLSWIEENI